MRQHAELQGLGASVRLRPRLGADRSGVFAVTPQRSTSAAVTRLIQVGDFDPGAALDALR